MARSAVLLAFAGGGAFAGIVGGSYVYMTAEAYMNCEPTKPVDKVTILVPALNEEKNLVRLLTSVNEQNVIKKWPELFTRLVVDNGSVDKTCDVAKRLGWNVVKSPRGKLQALHMGIMASSSDIIVHLDADQYIPPNSLNILLKPFSDSEVVMVNGANVYVGDWFAQAFSAFVYTINVAAGRMSGTFRAFRKLAYISVGGYRLDDPLANPQEEEEFSFWKRMAQVGKVKAEIKAVCETSPRRTVCDKARYIGCEVPPEYRDYCKQLGKCRF